MNSRLRVAFLSSMYGATWGGSEELWGSTALYLRQLGHDVFAGVIDWPGPATKRDELRAAGCQVSMRVDHAAFRDRVLNRFRPTSGQILQQNPVPSELLKFQPDLVVISQMFTDDGLAWMEYCLQHKLSYVTIVQAATEYRWPDDSLVSRLKAAYIGAKKTFFVCRHNLELCQKQISTRLANPSIVWNPNSADFDAVIPWPESDDGIFRMACVGRIQPDAKGQDVLIDVLAQEKWKQRPVALTFYGRGCNRLWAEEYCQLRGLKANFGGFATLHEIWRDHHLLVHPTRKEGLPIVMVEAALCGRPVVSTATAGIPEFVEDGLNGFLAPFADTKLFDEALECAWQQRDKWEAIGVRAREIALSKIGNDPVETFTELLLRLAGSM